MEISQGNSLYAYLKQIKMAFFKNKEQEGKTGGWGWYLWEGRRHNGRV
jgi:hypothetical protein